MKGTIPNKLYVGARQTRQVRTFIDREEVIARATPTIFTDADSKNSVETAKRWKNEYGRQVDQGYELIVENKPITNIRLFTIDCRSQGGRAYKCIDQEGQYFDLREDIFLDALYNGEVESRDGKVFLMGKYIWARIESHMKLIRFESNLYNELMESKARKELKKIPAKEMEIGVIYETKGGELFVYVGRSHYNDQFTQKKILGWNYVKLEEPWSFHEEEVAKWKVMNFQEKYEYSLERRKQRDYKFTSNKTFIRKVGEVQV